MARYFFTFGCGHPKYPKVAAVVHVEGPAGPETRERARDIFMDKFGTGWCAEYSEQQFRETRMSGEYSEVDYLELDPVRWDPFSG